MRAIIGIRSLFQFLREEFIEAAQFLLQVFLKKRGVENSAFDQEFLLFPVADTRGGAVETGSDFPDLIHVQEFLVVAEIDCQHVERGEHHGDFPFAEGVGVVSQEIPALPAEFIGLGGNALAVDVESHGILPPQLQRENENQIEFEQNDQGEHHDRNDRDVIPFPSA